MKKQIISLILLFLTLVIPNKGQSQACELQKYLISAVSDCVVLFRNCDNAFNFGIYSCQYRYCQSYSYDSQSNSYSCDSYAWQILDQNACANTCCIKPPITPFTGQSLDQCNLESEQAVANTGKILGIIFGSAGGVTVIVLIFCFACPFCKDKKCGDCCEFLGECCCCCCIKIKQWWNDQQMPDQKKVKHQEPSSIEMIENRNGDNPIFKFQYNGSLPWLNFFVQLFTLQDTCLKCNQQYPHAVAFCGHRFHTKCLIDYSKNNSKCQICSIKLQGTIKVACKKCRIKYKELPFRAKSTTQKQINSEMGSYLCYQCQIFQH